MSKAATQNAHWLTRTGSYATHATKTGVNKLGWECPESMTPEQERLAMVARVKQITEILSSGDLHTSLRARLGIEQRNLCQRIHRIRPKLRFRGLEAFFIDTVREQMSTPAYKAAMNEARKRWIKWHDEQDWEK